MTKLEEKIENLLKPIIENLGYNLFDVVYVKEAKDYYLRIFIDNEKGIIIDDCEKVSQAVSDELDEKDPIDASYSLEISSCGLEPKLREKKHFEMALGKEIEVKLYKAIEKEKVISGVLEKITDTEIVVNGKNIAFENIGSAKILFDWEESENG